MLFEVKDLMGVKELRQMLRGTAYANFSILFRLMS